MPLIRITSAADPRIADYRNVPDPELLRRLGLFVAENRLVVRLLLESTRFRTRSVLVTHAAYGALRDALEVVADDVPVFVSPKQMMEAISGYNIYRGCLALGERPDPVSVRTLLAALPGARLVVALEAIGNADNVGAVFRNARAFGVDAVIAGPACCDPLYRKALRVSIGASLVVPYATSERPNVPPSLANSELRRASRASDRHPVPTLESHGRWLEDLLALKAAGFTVVALTPASDTVDLEEFVARGLPEKIALLVGHEGDGLSPAAQRLADLRVRIEMVPGVDSLNVATAAAIALHRIYR